MVPAWGKPWREIISASPYIAKHIEEGGRKGAVDGRSKRPIWYAWVGSLACPRGSPHCDPTMYSCLSRMIKGMWFPRNENMGNIQKEESKNSRARGRGKCKPAQGNRGHGCLIGNKQEWLSRRFWSCPNWKPIRPNCTELREKRGKKELVFAELFGSAQTYCLSLEIFRPF